MPKIKTKKTNAGFALFSTLIFLSFLTTVTFLLVQTTSYQQRHYQNLKDYYQAQILASLLKQHTNKTKIDSQWGEATHGKDDILVCLKNQQRFTIKTTVD